MTSHREQDAAGKAAANAALDGIRLDPDEHALIAARRDGRIPHDEFLRAVKELALRKSGGLP